MHLCRLCIEWCAYPPPDSFRCQPTKHSTRMSGTQNPCCDLACMSSTSSHSSCGHQSSTHLLTHPINQSVSVNHHEKLYCSNRQLHATHCTSQVGACVHAESSACTLRLASVSYFISLVICVKADSADGTRQLACS